MTSSYAKKQWASGYENGLHYNRDLERVILGCALLLPAAMRTVSRELTGHDFHDSGHRDVFTTIDTMHRAAQPVDTITVWDHYHRVKKQPTINQVDIAPYITRLTDHVTCDTHLVFWCRCLKLLTKNRQSKAANPAGTSRTHEPGKRRFPWPFARFLIKSIDKQLLKQTASKYPNQTIRGGPYTIHVPSPEMVYLLHLISPENTYTTGASEADEAMTRQQCAAAVPRGRILKTTANGGRYWADPLNDYPSDWDNT